MKLIEEDGKVFLVYKLAGGIQNPIKVYIDDEHLLKLKKDLVDVFLKKFPEDKAVIAEKVAQLETLKIALDAKINDLKSKL